MSEFSAVSLFRLDGKVAVVTGGAGLLGTVCCAALAEFGARVVIADLDADVVCKAAERLSTEWGVEAEGCACDVSSPESVDKMVRRVVERFGRIDVLHNNAASKSTDLDAFFAAYEDYSLDQWRAVMSVNVDGMFLVSRAVGKQMVLQGTGGSIIQTSSIYGVVAPDQRIYEGSWNFGRAINTPAVYSTSKAAVVGLTRHLATYWADKGIRVNTLVPGGVQDAQNDLFVSRYSQRIPMGRMARKHEMVGALIYLASDASSYVTGQEIIVDGGLTAW